MPKLSELLQTAHDPNPAPEDAITTLKDVSGEATNKMVYLEDLPVSTAQAAADALKVNKAGDMMTGNLVMSSAYVDVNGARVISSTGFPNGVVSAPVGSKYIDKNATNGAVEWVKSSGTGNTGWVVSVGDTEWRWVTSLAPAGNIVSGSFAVRRTNNTVFIRGDNLTLNAANGVLIANAMADLGSGFMPMENYEAISRLSPSTYVATIAFSVQPGSATLGLRRFGSANAAYSTAQWSTVRGWPTVLPGVA